MGEASVAAVVEYELGDPEPGRVGARGEERCVQCRAA